MGLLLLSILVIAGVMAAMAIGVMLQGRCLRGSCGGPDAVDAGGEPLACATCPNRRRSNARDEAA